VALLRRTKLEAGTKFQDWIFVEDTGRSDAQGRAIGVFE
jgi:hypothetical protein